MSLLEDFQFSRGLVVPIYGRDDYEAAVGMVGDKLNARSFRVSQSRVFF